MSQKTREKKKEVDAWKLYLSFAVLYFLNLIFLAFSYIGISWDDESLVWISAFLFGVSTTLILILVWAFVMEASDKEGENEKRKN